MAAEIAIKKSISIMWNRYHDPLTLEELASVAIFSKFYYSRVFREITGISPGRFLSAIRLYMAKRHLLETPSSVTDISYRVGYNSLGTFTSRFTRSVGVSPAKYRVLADCGLPPITSFSMTCPDQPASLLTGRIRIPRIELDAPLRVYVGAFNTPIVEGVPQSCDVLDDAGTFRLSVPDGIWFVRAAAVAMHDGEDPVPRIRSPRLIGAAWPVKVVCGRAYTSDLQMRPLGPFDMPILLALPELDGRELAPLSQAAR
jgi:AraC-like DNA-binding protein